ncbi:MAG: hypothetical protein AAF567_01015 [Actinomycetota bacterium]
MTTAEARFLYDDCCPLCRGYTAVFTGLGWADRAAFSTIDDATLDDLDLDRARHFIPLHDPATGTVRYGMDGILSVVGESVPVLERIGRTRPVRAGLEAMYWVITYNRRHIVSAAPPEVGFDCAPDHHPAAVRTYIGIGLIVAVVLAVAGDIVLATAAVTIVSALGALRRHPTRQLALEPAIGHATTVLLATAGAGWIATILGAPGWLAGIVGAAVGARKLWLRRWIVTRR